MKGSMIEKKPKPKRKPRMTEREQQVLTGLAAGKTQTAIATELGTTPQNVSGIKRHLAEKTRRAPEILDAIGLDLQTGLERYLKPLLEARETKFFGHDTKEIVTDEETGDLKVRNNGYIIEEREVQANDIRLRALDMFAKLHGAYPRPGEGDGSDAPQNGVTINLTLLDPERARQLLGALDAVEATLVPSGS